MAVWNRRGAAVAVAGLAVLVTSGCAAGEDIEVTNHSDVTVTVRLGAEDLEEITAGGGVVLLDATECRAGPIVVTYAGGEVVELEESICPGQRLAIGDDTARIREIARG